MSQSGNAQPLLRSFDESSTEEPSERESVYFSLPVKEWRPAISSGMQAETIAALEQGKVICLPNLPFALTTDEQSFLRPDCVKPGTKSIKYSPAKQALWGIPDKKNKSPTLMGMMKRYAESARDLIVSLLPGYESFLDIGNTSFRPVEAKERAQSKRHDDQLLHVDAFPSRPNHGQRILRVFTNIHPDDYPRIWRVGEPFADVASHFMPKIQKPLPGSAALLRFLKITKGLRSPYDHYMLQLHDRMKLDPGYQQEVGYTTIPFLPGTSWVVFSDQVSHAVVSGQHAMEQTFMLPVTAMANPDNSPLHVLEKITGRQLR